MDDKEFVAQMAQFSSLEQMTNMSQGLTKVADLVARSQAVSLLGNAVDVTDGRGHHLAGSWTRSPAGTSRSSWSTETTMMPRMSRRSREASRQRAQRMSGGAKE